MNFFKKIMKSIVFVDRKTDMEITPSGIYTLVTPNLSLVKLPEGGAELGLSSHVPSTIYRVKS